MFSFTRIVALAMAAVICFAVIVPLALKRGEPALAIGISGAFALYIVANVVLMRRYKRR
ncbi:MAG: hypothetical protein M3R30_00950 [Candidatus Eremiobacteraeota bacterium]|nr:hypothetical protein [Candidatus Eremiobacteraeota bacterium]